ncbi:MAG: hypothetical protein HY070_10520 [Chloroflexi bacterium]|nr:hypothetical protein [Chloroflexota bacterium]MBI3740373.1 hypothetical protein [Chloroflexota bacterium]
MDSSLIGKIEKAKRYATEADRRVAFNQFTVTVQGDNNSYAVSFDHGRWACACHYFQTHGPCSHTMAMERILGAMLPPASEVAADARRAA